ncbi:pimeloyl-ACP methyl ester carboxylesterase [Kibdelosporangium banguiense]|uniref:Pimeloyl-ACP methyl ester carboxylesterase n=1 Tax=Kibdelosporangium banguiense TaxID=1365924 RepID=A0ABS4TW84_9PSEU|nr:alpha/beta hydrolase [Kibdelosporangium banguiense]MBP2328239.1 pimeloyl-ACP methyl ester carboxylesterase [Kibdelosporangium banguiense]
MSFVLIHGATMGADCWDRLIPLLDGEVLAVDLPGRGKRRDTDVRTVTLDDCGEAVAADILERDLTDIVLVGHSFGGVTVPRVMKLVPDRIRRVVLLSAVVPEDGTRVLDQIDPEVRASVEASITDGVYSIDADAARAMLCNDADEEQSQFILSRVVDDAAALLAETVDLSGYRLPIPRTYVRLSEDHCYPPDLQAKSVQRIDPDVTTLRSGHMAMVTIPELLATVLNA